MTKVISTAGNLIFIVLAVAGANVSAQNLASSRSEAFKNPKGIRFADQFAGATAAAQINTAVADCGSYTGSPGNSCLVVIPSTMSCGEGNEFPDNVMVWDFRNCSQSQGLRFNLSRTVTGNVRSKMFLQDNFDARTIALDKANKNSATVYVSSWVDNPQVTTGAIEAFNSSVNVNTQAGTFNGTLVAAEFDTFANETNSSPQTVTNATGVYAGVTAGGNTSITNAIGFQAPAFENPGTGRIMNAIGFLADAQTAGANANLSFFSKGNSAFNEPISIGMFPAITPQQSASLFIRSNDLTGSTQFGIQTAPTTNGTATSEGAGIAARADTAAVSFTQRLNTGVHVQTPGVGSGSTVSEWNGVRIEGAPKAGKAFSIKSLDTSAVASFAGPMVIGGGSTINKVLNGSATLAYTAIAGQTCQEQTLAIKGASITNFGVFGSPRASLGSINLSWSAWVRAANAVSIRVCNPTNGSITPHAVAWGVTVNQ